MKDKDVIKSLNKLIHFRKNKLNRKEYILYFIKINLSVFFLFVFFGLMTLLSLFMDISPIRLIMLRIGFIGLLVLPILNSLLIAAISNMRYNYIKNTNTLLIFYIAAITLSLFYVLTMAYIYIECMENPGSGLVWTMFAIFVFARAFLISFSIKILQFIVLLGKKEDPRK
jgi:hypothetical protein